MGQVSVIRWLVHFGMCGVHGVRHSHPSAYLLNSPILNTKKVKKMNYAITLSYTENPCQSGNQLTNTGNNEG